MADGSAIEWTDATWNPVRGCTKVSPGCKHCYAETFSERFRGVPGHPFQHGFDLRLVPTALELPIRWRASRRIFVNSMSDLFHDGVPEDYVRSVFDVMRRAPQHEFQVLTKRSSRMVEIASRLNLTTNIWMGVSVENEDYVSRIDDLRRVDTAVRFLSVEPLLGPIKKLELRGIHWVIVGGESGPRARPLDTDWVRSIRDQCLASKVRFFFKQWGGVRKHTTGRQLDGRTWDEMPDRGGARPAKLAVVS
ncbi:MAG TPA: phage Gp37/Gp68 family protein [Kofleriaceae bacterium]|jgi:protein gp37